MAENCVFKNIFLSISEWSSVEGIWQKAANYKRCQTTGQAQVFEIYLHIPLQKKEKKEKKKDNKENN